MKCKQFQQYFEKHLITDQGPKTDIDIAGHLSVCLECNRFVETLKELRSGLRLLRDSAPAVPPSVDAAVIAAYRDRSHSLREGKVSFWSRRHAAAFGWGLALATALVLIAVMVFARRNAVTPAVQSRGPEVVTSPQVQAPKTGTAQHINDRTESHVARSRQAQEMLSSTSAAPSFPASAVDPPAEGFRSLMYCDELSCGEGMELVRVQLPSPPGDLAPSAAQFQRMVSADVLIGPDGVARGIRIVQ
jgi:hypothetical protein